MSRGGRWEGRIEESEEPKMHALSKEDDEDAAEEEEEESRERRSRRKVEQRFYFGAIARFPSECIGS